MGCIGQDRAPACHVRSDQSDQQDRGSAGLRVENTRIPGQPPSLNQSLGCLSDSTPAITSRIGKPVQARPTPLGGGPRVVTQSVTQAQDTDTDTGPAKPMPMPMPSSPSAPPLPVLIPPNPHPHPWTSLLLFYYAYFYFVPITVPSFVGQLTIPASGGFSVCGISHGSSCLQSSSRPGLARCIPSYITAADLAHLGGEARATATAIHSNNTRAGCPAHRSRPHPPPLGQPPRRQT